MSTTDDSTKKPTTKSGSKKITDFRVWKPTHNLKSEGIIIKGTRNQATIRALSAALNEEENNYLKKRIQQLKDNELNQENMKNSTYLSDNVQKIVSDVTKTMRKMTQSNEEIKKLNAQYLKTTTEKINKNTLQTETNKDISLPGINSSYRNGSLSPAAKTKKEKPHENFKYVNDNYRKQLNKAFLNFNPIIHLGNLNMLRKADPEINEDIIKLTKQIDTDLDEITSKDYYKNHYEKVLKDNEKIRKKQMKKNEAMSSSSPIQTTAASQTRVTPMMKNSFKVFLKMQLNNRNKSEQKKKIPYKEQKEAELYLMTNALMKIGTTISKENLNRFYRDYKDMKSLSVRDQQWIYFSDMKKAEEILKQIHKERIMKRTDEEMMLKDKNYKRGDEELIQKRVYENAKALLKTIGNSKDILMSDIKLEEEN